MTEIKQELLYCGIRMGPVDVRKGPGSLWMTGDGQTMNFGRSDSKIATETSLAPALVNNTILETELAITKTHLL